MFLDENFSKENVECYLSCNLGSLKLVPRLHMSRYGVPMSQIVLIMVTILGF